MINNKTSSYMEKFDGLEKFLIKKLPVYIS